MSRFFRAFMAVVIIAALLVAGVSTAVTNALTRPAAPVRTTGAEETEEIAFTIEAGETVAEIAYRLRANRLISSPLLFRVIVAQQGEGKTLPPGTYRLRRGMSLSEILAALQAGPVGDKRGGRLDMRSGAGSH